MHHTALPAETATRWQQVRQHARLWRACLNLALVREAQFRANLITTVVIGLAQVFAALVPVLLLFSFADSIDGWSRADAIVILGVYQLVAGLISMLLSRNMYEISDAITKGMLDVVLIRPVNAQFYLTSRWIRPDQSFKVATGFLLIAIGLNRGHGLPPPLDIAQFVILLVTGFILITCCWSCLAFCAFWMHSVGSMMMFFQDLLEVGRYPISFFPLAIRMLFTAVVPLAFLTTFPAQSLTGGISWWVVLIAIAFATFALDATRRFWHFAVRRYSGASS